MSGGSFNYLCNYDFAERNQDLARMAMRLRRLGFDDAAEETERFMRIASNEIRAVWKAIEWVESADWYFDEIINAVDAWREFNRMWDDEDEPDSPLDSGASTR